MRRALHIGALAAGLILALVNIFAAGPTIDTIGLYLVTSMFPYIIYLAATRKSRVLFTLIAPLMIAFFTHISIEAAYFAQIARGAGLAYGPYITSSLIIIAAIALSLAISAGIAAFLRRV